MTFLNEDRDSTTSLLSLDRTLGKSRRTQMRDKHIRCPVGPKRLLAIFRASGERPQVSDDGLLVEFACSDCAKELRRAGYDVARVLHRYNVVGELVESVEVPRGSEAITKDSKGAE